MTPQCTILVRYDEIGLKGKNRSMFINRLADNIRRPLKDLEGVQIQKPHGRIRIDCPSEVADAVALRLAYIPGIASFSLGVAMDPDFDAMAEQGVEWIELLIPPGGTFKFCVQTRRSNKRFPKTSTEVNYEVGSRILGRLHERGLEVDINNAQFTLEIEIGLEQTVVFKNRIAGLRGLPVGSSGEVLGLISGGIDSPVALFRIIKRGCRVHGIFFDNQPYMGRGGYDKVKRLSKQLNRYQSGACLYVVPFEKIQESIRDHCRPANRVVLYRRMMYRIAQAVAEQNRYQALVTGESLGQVASQTLENLNAVSSLVSLSVFRPLIGTNKNEIIQMARELGTYEISIEPQPDCCSVFMPSNPTTKSNPKYLEHDETEYPWQELMQDAIAKMEVIDLDTLH
ncbi:tRNA uracil 4-sulfurtransferase ThiI [Nitrospina watsonii]|uniref:Probable tRNA sulfurtransferase n=1 Tax=Nitrospina watsonii TaxID=1323948 RepID=A0ABM9HEA8_9BACT|nr:tRNA uracil 4-sulfurtransferase ThiI [Nitrospina watsonii]CAI2718589.1 putative tRNA sulfurtransferase [Nitrospina watsonii]